MLKFSKLMALIFCISSMPAAAKIEKDQMTNQEAYKIYQNYLEAWKAVSNEKRKQIAEAVVVVDVKYSTPRHARGNRETVIEDMAAFQTKFPGGHFEIGDVAVHHDVALLTWVLVKPDGAIFAKGHDQLRVSQEGKIIELITFPPSVEKP